MHPHRESRIKLHFFKICHDNDSNRVLICDTKVSAVNFLTISCKKMHTIYYIFLHLSGCIWFIFHILELSSRLMAVWRYNKMLYFILSSLLYIFNWTKVRTKRRFSSKPALKVVLCSRTLYPLLCREGYWKHWPVFTLHISEESCGSECGSWIVLIYQRYAINSIAHLILSTWLCQLKKMRQLRK